MDGVDFRILASLHEDGLLSQAAIGRRVGLTAPAVANRLRRMKEERILLGFRADVHPAVFDQTSTMHVLPGPFEAADVERALAKTNVVWVAWKTDGGITLMSYGAADVHDLGEPEMTIAGDGRSADTVPPLAYRVLAAVVAAPRAGRDMLAQITGLSPKTCVKYRDEAIRRGHLAVLPVLGTLRGEGAVVYHAAVFGDVAVKAVGAALQQAIIVNEARQVQYWFAMAPDFATAMNRQRAVAQIGAQIHVTMNRDLVQNDDRLIAWLNEAAIIRGPNDPTEPRDLARPRLGNEGWKG